MERCDVLVIGAGMAGLTAARVLRAAGRSVAVLDKGRGVGGRMATRRFAEGTFDHGAQFFTAKDPRFAASAAEWLRDGTAVEWARGFHDGAALRADGRPRYRGADGMTTVPKALAAGLDVRLGDAVTRCAPEGAGWRVETAAGAVWDAGALLLTAPTPQSLALLDAGGVTLPSRERTMLESLLYEPCLALLAVLDGPSAVPDPGGLRIDAEPIAWIADNRKKGISAGTHALTIHAGPEFSRARFEEEDDEAAREMLAAAAPWLGSRVIARQLHRWRYARPLTIAPERCLVLRAPGVLAFAGDAFAGPRVEGAALSGLAAGEALAAEE